MQKLAEKYIGRGARGEDGFTLIEMVVVVGIIVALAAVIVPLVIQFAGQGDTGAASAEWDAVQSAVDTMMADNNLTTITAAAANAFVTDSFDFDAGAGTQTLASYTRDTTTAHCYTWAASGRILTQVAATGSPPACP